MEKPAITDIGGQVGKAQDALIHSDMSLDHVLPELRQ